MTSITTLPPEFNELWESTIDAEGNVTQTCVLYDVDSMTNPDSPRYLGCRRKRVVLTTPDGQTIISDSRHSVFPVTSPVTTPCAPSLLNL